MIAPARRAAFEALLAHHRGTDLPAALAAAHRAVNDPRDHDLLTELVTGTVRMQRALDYQLTSRSARPLAALDPPVLIGLRLGAFQLLHLDRVPASAVVNDAVALTKRAGKTSASGLVNAVLRALARDRDALTWPDASTAEGLAIRYSHPTWLVERWLSRLGREATERWLAFDNTPPRLTLAVNPRAGTREALVERLAAEGVRTEPTPRAPHGLHVVSGPAVASASVREGVCLMQEEASQLIAELGEVSPGDRVLDLCAAPGGKTVALAGRVGPTGLVVSCDVRPRRVRLLRETIARTKLDRVAVVQVPASGSLPFREASFDLVLVDAPCSGLGTLRRDPDIRWSRTQEDLPRLAATQQDLLTRAAPLVAQDGQLVYATCSGEPEENDDVVRAFLEAHPGWHLVATHKTLPATDGLEAFCGAVLARNL
ncbi:MAG: 16S rRNA (cytosine(967)-C(5))-methyltransferase RsmB [Acidobacteria bacterium]|nr:16S rRNA (cytosine(967)-C(5))-methyltransferase RsmB [Acidobacteriota bacterium]